MDCQVSGPKDEVLFESVVQKVFRSFNMRRPVKEELMLSKIIRRLHDWRCYWFPPKVSVDQVKPALAEFYSTREDYHAMTAGGDKTQDPQVKFVLETLKTDWACVEFGCGGGVVLSKISEKVDRLIGLDLAMHALLKAKGRLARENKCMLIQCDNAVAPVRSGYADATYSFEVLEHVWDPEKVISEMIRILKAGGLLVLSMPNGFSLDLHLKKRLLPAIFDHLGAALVWIRSFFSQKMFWNIEPDLNCQEVYPDCDMITKVFPRNLYRFLEHNECRVERLETFFFQQHNAENKQARRRFSRLERHPFYHNFGDHIFCVAEKIK